MHIWIHRDCHSIHKTCKSWDRQIWAWKREADSNSYFKQRKLIIFLQLIAAERRKVSFIKWSVIGHINNILWQAACSATAGQHKADSMFFVYVLFLFFVLYVCILFFCFNFCVLNKEHKFWLSKGWVWFNQWIWRRKKNMTKIAFNVKNCFKCRTEPFVGNRRKTQKEWRIQIWVYSWSN